MNKNDVIQALEALESLDIAGAAGESAREKLGAVLYRALGKTPAWSQFDEFRSAFVAGWIAAHPKAEQKSGAKAWQRAFQVGVSDLDMVRPVCDSADAIAAAARREKAAADLQKQFGGFSRAELEAKRKASYAAAMNGDRVAARVAAKLETVIAARKRVENAASDERVSAIWRQIKDFARAGEGQCRDIARLNKALSALRGE